MTTVMEKVAPNLSTTEGILPASVQSGMSSLPNNPAIQNPFGNFSQLGKNIPDSISSGLSNSNSQTASSSKSSPQHTSYGSRTEKVLDSFLKSPALKGEDRDSNRLLNDTVWTSYLTLVCRVFDCCSVCGIPFARIYFCHSFSATDLPANIYLDHQKT